jgi:hypothetical protein
MCPSRGRRRTPPFPTNMRVPLLALALMAAAAAAVVPMAGAQDTTADAPPAPGVNVTAPPPYMPSLVQLMAATLQRVLVGLRALPGGIRLVARTTPAVISCSVLVGTPRCKVGYTWTIPAVTKLSVFWRNNVVKSVTPPYALGMPRFLKPADQCYVTQRKPPVVKAGAVQVQYSPPIA